VTIACVDRVGVKPRRLPPEMVTRLRALEQKET
jgi:acyl-CoA thioesterase FadM